MIEAAILTGKWLSLFLGTAYGYTCIARAFRGQAVSQTQTFLFAASSASFITLQWLL